MRPNAELALSTRPTHLAPGRTLAWPAVLPRTAGGLLPHPFSPHPRPCGHVGGHACCCGCSHLAVTREVPPLAVSWGGLPTSLTGWVGVGKFLPEDALQGGGSPANQDHSNAGRERCQKFAGMISAGIGDVLKRIELHQHDFAPAGSDQLSAAELAHDPDRRLDRGAGHVSHVLARQRHLDHAALGQV